MDETPSTNNKYEVYNSKIGIMLDFPLLATSDGSEMKCASPFVNQKDKQF